MLSNLKRILAVAGTSLLFRIFIGAAVAIGGFVWVPQLIERVNERPVENTTEETRSVAPVQVPALNGSDAPESYVQAFKVGFPVPNMSFGFSVAASGDDLVGGAYRDANYRGSVSFFSRTGGLWSAGPTLAGNDSAADDNFGWSVAISGDTAIAGANLDDGQSIDQGSAYVFLRNPEWAQQQKLTAVDGSADDQFGISVAVSGDTAVVGAFGANSSRGAAYIFTRSGTNWTQQQKLTAPDGAAGDEFGWTVSVNGDTAVIGAPGDDGTRGSAYMFKRSGASWTQEAKLTASDGATFDRFGYSVAVAGDTVITGSVGDDNGSAYAFFRSGTSWSQQQKLTASDGGSADKFGASVAISGDRIIIGAEGDDIGANADQGSAYLFLRSGTAWTQEQKLIASDGAPSDIFGGSVSLSGNLAVVGSYLDDLVVNERDHGSIYAFVDSGATPTPTATPTNTPSASPTSSPTATPTNSPTSTPTNTPTATPTATGSATPTPTPTPGSGIEGDMAPRNAGDAQLLANDVTQSRRFVVGLDTPATSPNEYQRADVAPASTRGDGVLNSADTVQARRYVSALDAQQDAGGPTQPEAAPGTLSGLIDSIYSYFAGRSISIGRAQTSDRSIVLPVEIEAFGDVSGASFTIEFDPTVFKIVRLELGKDAPEGSALTVNSDDASNGRIALLVDSATPVHAGGSKAIVNVVVEAADTRSEDATVIRITSSIAQIALSDANGNSLSVYTKDKGLQITRSN